MAPPPRKTLKKGSRRVPTFIQENSYYCGPATAKMTLKWLGVTKTQDRLWDVIQDEADAQGLPACEACPPVECVEWYTPPEALEGTLRSLAKKAAIKLIREPDVAATDHALVWSVLNDVPGIALVYGWSHWVVIHGYHVDRVPTAITDTNYQVLGFDVIDPAGGQNTREFIDGARWRRDYLTGVVCGRFAGQFVAVCDPEPERPKGGPTVRKSKPRRERLLPMERTGPTAEARIRSAGLLADEVWRKAMARAKPGPPRLVQRLDRPQSFYALVPFVRRKGVTAQALVDVQTGEMTGARAAETTDTSLAMPKSDKALLDYVASQRLILPGVRPMTTLRREALSVSPTLVWKPCRESLSPYLAFSVVTYGDRVIYVRTDGAVFTSLTEAPAGG